MSTRKTPPKNEFSHDHVVSAISILGEKVDNLNHRISEGLTEVSRRINALEGANTTRVTREDLQRLEEAVNSRASHEDMKKVESKVTAMEREHGSRITRLEKWYLRITGGVASLGLVLVLSKAWELMKLK